jgi:nitroreductase
MASMAALLSAVDQELGACFFGIPVDRIAAVREAFKVPMSQLSVGVISLGYPGSMRVMGSPTRRPRKAASEVVHRGIW